jgi:ABC-type nitrate/sulfonate/bicarbonate transport system permease component
VDPGVANPDPVLGRLGAAPQRIAGRPRPARRSKVAVDRRRKTLKWTVRIGAVVAFLLVWQFYAAGVNPILLVAPIKIASAFGSMMSDGTLPKAFLSSAEVLLVGFFGGLTFGVAVGLIWARFAPVDWAIQPFVSAFWSTPLIALVPLYVMWFGFGFAAKAIIVGSFSFFPILINTYQGASSVDRTLLDVAASFGCDNRRTWRHVVLPAAVPFIVAGVNVAIGHALTGLIIAEFYTNATGLGGIVLKSADTFQTAQMLVPVIVLMILGILLMGSTRRLKRRFAKWSTLSEQQ